jgi:hypothetical protein
MSTETWWAAVAAESTIRNERRKETVGAAL